MNANDLEREVRSMLDERSRAARVAETMPGGVVRRGRRRQLVSAAAALVLVALVAGAGLVGARAIGGGRETPIAPAGAAVRTATVNGVTMTYPRDWYLIAFGPVDGGGDLIQLSNFDTASTKPCFTGDAVELPANGVLLLLDRGNGAVGPGSPHWPVALTYDPSPSACRPGGLLETPQPEVALHYSASWTSADDATPYEANAIVGPDASDADRSAMFDSFASLSVSGSGEAYAGPLAYVLDAGTAGGRPWLLLGPARSPEYPDVKPAVELFGAGADGEHVPAARAAGLDTVWAPDGSLAWGAAAPDVVRIVATGQNGVSDRASIVRLPPSFGVNGSAFVVTVPDASATTLVAYDASGREIWNEAAGMATAAATAIPPPATP